MELQVKLYNRYFEFNLEKTIGATVPQPQENTPHNVPTEAAQQAEAITQQLKLPALKGGLPGADFINSI